MAAITGIVTKNGVPVKRVVRAYRMDNGKFVGHAASDASTGAFSITTADTSAHFAVVHDNTSDVDELLNEIVFELDLPAVQNGTTIKDATGKTITVVGNAVTKTDVTKYDAASVYFDGTGDYLRCDAVATALIGATEYSIDGWFRMTSVMTGSNALFGFHNSTGATNRAVITNNNMFGSNFTSTVTHPSLPLSDDLGTFVHIAFELYNGVYTLYRNGAVLSSTPAVGANDIASGDTFTIGQEFDSSLAATDFFNGHVDGRFRVTKKARYKGAFTAPTAIAPPLLVLSIDDNALIFDNLTPV